MGQSIEVGPTVSFTQMRDGTKEDYQLLDNEADPWQDELATRLLKELDSAGDVPAQDATNIVVANKPVRVNVIPPLICLPHFLVSALRDDSTSLAQHSPPAIPRR